MIRAALILVLLLLPACGGGITPIRTPFNKGVYQYSRRNWDEAVHLFREALEEDPEDYRARFNLASALEAKAEQLELGGKPAEAHELRLDAMQHYRRILEQRPRSLRAAVNLAAARYDRGHTEVAKEGLRALIAGHPAVPLPRVALAAHLYREARGLEDAKVRGRRLEEAEEQLRHALHIDVASVQANMLLGRVLQAQGRRQEAREAYEDALEAEPNDVATLMALGDLAYDAGDFQEAVPWFRRVLFIDEDHWRAHLRLSRALEGLDDLEGATAHLWEARRLESLRPAGVPRPEYRRTLRDYYGRLVRELEGEAER